jgi:hypothetical protein
MSSASPLFMGFERNPQGFTIAAFVYPLAIFGFSCFIVCNLFLLLSSFFFLLSDFLLMRRFSFLFLSLYRLFMRGWD